MAEIKTYRCDICGKVYHSDEVKTEVVLAIKPESEDAKSYDHICNECLCILSLLLADPNVIKEEWRKRDESNAYGYELEHLNGADTIK